MTRLQKKCMIFSLGLHGLMAVILFAGAGFRNNPPPKEDLQIMTLIPANIVDRAGAGGGTPVVNLAPQPPAHPPAEARAPQPPAVRPEPVERVPTPTPTPTPRPVKEVKPPKPDEPDDVSLEPAPKAPKRSSRQPIQVSYAPAHAAAKRIKTDKTPSSDSSERAEARRLKEIQNSLDELASGVRSSGSPNTIVDVAGIGGGESFASYRDVVFSAYYHAWFTPDNAASRVASADARVTIARDGSILAAELMRPSDDGALNKSVEQALRRVTKLPPFPASARDAQRTFVIRFSLEAKEMSG